MTKQFEERKFNISKLKGISEKTIEEHLKLYAGYVKNANEILASGQFERRFPFEFNGMRNHEIYFSHFEGGPQPLSPDSAITKAGFDLEKFKALALTRGVGWAMVVWDPISKRLLNNWVDEHHLGQLYSCIPVIALDMWEHAYFIDYTPGEKKKYIEAFFENLNWRNVEENFANATRQ